MFPTLRTKSFASILPTTFMAVFLGCILLYIAVGLFFDFKEVQDNSFQIEKKFFKEEKSKIKREVDRTIEFIDFEQKQFSTAINTSLQEAAGDFLNIVGASPENSAAPLYQDGKWQFLQETRASLDLLTTQQVSFWVLEQNGKAIWSSSSKSTDRVDDLNTPITTEDLLALMRSEERFKVQYNWRKSPDGNLQMNALAIRVEELKDQDYFLFVAQDITQEVAELQKEILGHVGNVKFGESYDGYLFAFRYDGLYLMHIAKNYIGQMLLDIEDPTGFKMNQEMVRIAKTKGSGFVSYLWDRYSKNQLIEKVSYVRGYPEWRLVIGSGFYLDDLNSQIEAQKLAFWNKKRDHFLRVLLWFIVSISIVALVAWYFAKVMTRELRVFTSYFHDLTKNLRPLSLNELTFSEFKALAVNVNEMVVARQNAEETINTKATELSDALIQRETLIQEVHHRVKNNLQVILSMLSLQKRTSQGDHEVHALNESSRRVRVMAKLYEHLYQSDNVSDIGPKEYLSEVLNDALHAAGAPDDVEANLDCDDVTLKIKTATALAQIISELISNCLKHAFPDGTGQIEVSLKRLNEKELCLIVSDDGVGLPDGFDEKKLKSMGMKLVSALVMQIGGTKQIKSNGGTTVEITFEENN